ncbi:MAG TPA: hypothetical protein DCZ94_18465 [Lentisphaeria bacterium]|nr:MAG: hypothetical protein A2X48_24025 [Lentisphaerae bacterium GWF2_49_21]HBC88931.1 hypothetical protein [Lentisphaeria bacterium]
MAEREFTTIAILQASSWILFAVAIGAFIANIIESRNWTGFIAFIAKPLLKFSRLPGVCGVSFGTAFFSNNAAGSMIASAYSEGKITRKEMFIGAITNSFPAKFKHMMRPAVVIVPLLGLTAILYLAIQLVLEVLQVLLVFSFGRRKTLEKTECEVPEEKAPPPWKESIRNSLKATGKILLRVLLITLPIFIFVAYLGDKGVFKKMEKRIPKDLQTVLSPEIIAIMGSKMGGLVSSATVADKMFKEGRVTSLQILIALMAANMITIPFSALRRNLPTALGIFPKRDGAWIVGITQSLRFVFNLAALAILIIIQLNI